MCNQEIDAQNIREGRVGRHKRRHRTAAQIFKARVFLPCTSDKGGINWAAYRGRVLRPILYRWIREEVQPRLLEETGDDTV